MATPKGIILAGGLGTRLSPLTNGENKHYLPVYNRRMVEYPLSTLVATGIKDVVLVTGGNKPGQFLELLRNGRQYGLDRLYYTYQEGNGGIADAMLLAEPFMEPDQSCVVILGDNYFEAPPIFPKEIKGGHILIKPTDQPWHFGIATVENSKVIHIEEKPQNPTSNLAILGCYAFDHSVWGYLREIDPSERGEKEITDVLSRYLEAEQLYFSEYHDYWRDMGTFENWQCVSSRV